MFSPAERVTFALAFTCTALMAEWFALVAAFGVRYPAFHPTFWGVIVFSATHLFLFIWVVLVQEMAARWGPARGQIALRLLWILALFPAFVFFRDQTNLAVEWPLFSVSWWRTALGPVGAGIAALGLATAAGAAIYRWPLRLARLASIAVTLLLPFYFFQYARLVWTAVSAPTLPALAPPPNSKHEGPRVIFVVFDEWDLAAVEAAQRSGERFPALDALRSRGLWAKNAYSPAVHTHASMPSYFIGRRVEGFCRLPDDDMDLVLEGEPGVKRRWSQLPSLPELAYEAGLTVGLVGWYHPYCALMASGLRTCSGSRHAFFHLNGMDWGRVRGALSMAFNPFQNVIPYHRSRYRALERRALALVRDEGVDLAVIHLPVPHLPGVWDRDSARLQVDKMGGEAEQRAAYLSNLLLSDLLLRKLLEASSQTSLSGQTAWVVTSDHALHSWRWKRGQAAEPDRRIPFILRLPGQTKAVVFDGGFNTVLTADLTMAIAQRQVQTAEQAVAFIKGHPLRFPLPPVQSKDLCPEPPH